MVCLLPAENKLQGIESFVLFIAISPESWTVAGSQESAGQDAAQRLHIYFQLKLMSQIQEKKKVKKTVRNPAGSAI